MDHAVQIFGDYMDQLLIDMAFAVLFSTIKDPRKVAKMKAALRKLRDQLMRLPLDT